jgi:hypothetical protein
MYIQAPMDILKKEAEEYKKRHELKDYFLNVKGKEYVSPNDSTNDHLVTSLCNP